MHFIPERYRIIALCCAFAMAAIQASAPAHADLVASFTFNQSLVHVSTGGAITLSGTLTVDPSSTENFITRGNALLFSGGYPVEYLATVLPEDFSWPNYTIDESSFVATISHLDLAPGQSAVFSYGTLFPRAPITPGIYHVPDSPDAFGDGAIFASTYCDSLTCDIVSGPAFEPANSVTIVVTPVAEPASLPLLGMGMIGLWFAQRRRPEDQSKSVTASL